MSATVAARLLLPLRGPMPRAYWRARRGLCRSLAVRSQEEVKKLENLGGERKERERGRGTFGERHM